MASSIPQSGDIYVVRRKFYALSGCVYDVGDILELIEPTGQAPFGYASGLCNWQVKCKNFQPPDKRAVWSAIWMLIDNRMIELKEKS